MLVPLNILGVLRWLVPLPQPKLPVYDEEDWLPGREATDGSVEEDEEDGVGKKHRVSQSVLKDLGNKYTGDEMDLIAKTAQHSYYLRSLEQTQYYPRQDGKEPSGLPVPAQDVATVVCPYDIPEPHLPAPPTPKGNTAADYYEALNARDQEIRKGMLGVCWEWEG